MLKPNRVAIKIQAASRLLGDIALGERDPLQKGLPPSAKLHNIRPDAATGA